MTLGALPTPVERAAELGQAIGVPELYLKRDDRLGQPYGGSKVRKLEFLLARAEQQGCAEVVTFGGLGSNHALATALYAPRRGLRAVLHLVPEPWSEHVRYRLLAELGLGAELRYGQSLKRARARAAPSCRIEPGGTEPVGDLGFVNAAFELAEQVAAGQLPAPDRIYLAAGTLGSAAGLAIGLQAAGLSTKVMAVSVAPAANLGRLRSELSRTARWLHERDESFPAAVPSRATVELVSGQLGQGYARPTSRARQARDLASSHGVELDLTYTAKAFAALRAHRAELAGQVVLFWLSYDPRRLPLRPVAVEQVPKPLRPFVFRKGPAR